MKNYIFIIILSFLSTSLFSQNKKIKSSKAEPHEKTSYNETGLLNSKKKKKKKKKNKEKNAEKTDTKKVESGKALSLCQWRFCHNGFGDHFW